MSYRTALIDGSGFAKAAYVPEKRALCHRFIQRIFSLMITNPGIKIYVAWDPFDNVSKRVERFPDYKKSRRIKVIDKNYLYELRNLFELLSFLGVDQGWSIGWEADDILGTLARIVPDPIIVLTRDRDMMQLVTDKCYVLIKIKSKEIVYTPSLILKQRGIPVNLITDWKALAGDSGDDVPGIKGIGEKTATEILIAYPNTVKYILENSYCPEFHDKKLTKRTWNLLYNASREAEKLRLMKWLVELHDVPITFLKGKKDLKRAKIELRNSGLVILSSRVRELL